LQRNNNINAHVRKITPFASFYIFEAGVRLYTYSILYSENK